MSKECTTHHHACDCREEKFKQLEQENAALRNLLRDIRSNNCDGFELTARIAALKSAIDAARKEGP
jgi:TPP-dependent pyruvate/acetoin dehydrogenase alpha subunit